MISQKNLGDFAAHNLHNANNTAGSLDHDLKMCWHFFTIANKNNMSQF